MFSVWPDLLTNAHLLRPFLDSGDTTDTTDAAFTPSLGEDAMSEPTLLYDDAIRLKSFARLSVRVDGVHQQRVDGEEEGDILSDAGWLGARLIYVSKGPWDVAILKVACSRPLWPIAVHPTFRRVSTATTPPVGCLPSVGSAALAIGHALFAPASALPPTVTAGVISKVVHLSSEDGPPPRASSTYPALVMTSAAIHNGNSGGLLIDRASGYLLGMVTSNVMHTPVAPHAMSPTLVRKGPDSYAHEGRVTELQRVHDETCRIDEETRQTEMGHTIIPHLNFRSATARNIFECEGVWGWGTL